MAPDWPRPLQSQLATQAIKYRRDPRPLDSLGVQERLGPTRDEDQEQFYDDPGLQQDIAKLRTLFTSTTAPAVLENKVFITLCQILFY